MTRYAIYLLVFFNAVNAYTQQLRPPITNFTPKNYGTDQTPENYCIFQDSRGFIFAGNANKVIMFDGRTWEAIPVQDGSFVTAIEEDASGTIYVGTSGGQFGKLSESPNGKLKFTSLLKHYQKTETELGWVQRIYCIGKQVYLFTPDDLFFIQGNKIENVQTETSFQLIFKCENKIFARERQVGLVEINGTKKTILAQNTELKDYGIFGVIPYDEHQLMIITQEKGLWLYNKLNKQTLCFSADSVKLKQHLIFGGIKLHDGNFAFNSIVAGVLIVNSSGKVITTLNKASGLRVNDVKQVIQDKHHNLWLATTNGIGLINYGSFLHYYDDETGLLGGIECVYQLDKRLYVGTSEGLFTEKMNDTEKHFTQIESVKSQVWNMDTDLKNMFVATTNGIYEGTTTGFTQIFIQPTNTLVYLKNKNQLLTAGPYGIYLIDVRTKKLITQNIFKYPLTRCISLCIDPASTNEKTIAWMGTVKSGIFKITLENNELTYQVFRNLEDRSLPFTRPVIIDNKMYFCTATGLRKLILDEDSMEYFETENMLPGLDTIYVTDIRQTGKRIWVCAKNKISHFEDDKKQVTIPFMPIDMGRINNLYAESDNSCWIAAADGLIKYTEFYDRKYNEEFDVVLRKVVINNDSVFFHGTWRNKGVLTNKQPKDDKIELDYKYNTYEFTFSALFFEAIDKIEYKHMLVGHETEWSSWSTDSKIKYSNLREGDYALHVKAKNVYGYVSKDFVFKFTILPPWYRTTAAYIVYGALAILIFILINRILSYRLKRKNIQLEEIVKIRTQEINEQYVQIRHQKQEITDSINYAQKIQEAMLPFVKELKADIPDSFVLFKPKDIVSGDFYWYGKYDHKMVIICADCTGHGVPGAFMSMLCVDKLNQIIPEKKILMPDKILEAANKGIKKSLGQSDEQNLKTKDGMDVAVVTIDIHKNKLYYSGANRTLWQIRNDEIIEHKPDKCAVGGFTPEDKVYTLHEIDIHKNDRFYLSTDGYADQFGGPRGKKIMVKTYKDILMEHHKKPMEVQKEKLDDFIEAWKKHADGDNPEHEQVDDVCVIGIKI